MALTEKVKIIIDVVGDSAKNELANVKKGFSDAGDSFGGLGKMGGQVLSTLKAHAAEFATAAAAAVVAFGVKSVNAFQDLALQAGKFSDATGTTVEDASRLIEVFGDMGVEASTVQGALNKMNVAIAKGGEEFAGLRDAGGDTTKTFLNVVNYLNGIQDPAERARQGTKLLGKSWTEMSEGIAEGAQGLAKSMAEVSDAKIIDKGELENARDFRDAIDNLKDQVEDLTLTIGGGLVQEMNKWLMILGKVQEAIDALPDIPEPPGGWFDFVANGLPIIGTLNQMGDAVDKLDKEQKKNTETTKDAGAAARSAQADYKAQQEAQEDAAKATEELEKATRELINAQLAAASAQFGAADAYDRAIEAIEAANKATDDGTTTINEKQAADRKAIDSAIKYAAAETKAAEETAKANGQQFGAQQAAEVQVQALERVKQQFPALTPVIDQYIDKLKRAADTQVTTTISAKADLASVDRELAKIQADIDAGRPIKVPASLMFNPMAPGFMAGGPVRETGWYTVGEAGRETVLLPGGSRVLNHSQTESALRGSGGPASIIYNISVSVAGTAQPADVGRELVGAIQAFERANGSSWRN